MINEPTKDLFDTFILKGLTKKIIINHSLQKDFREQS